MSSSISSWQILTAHTKPFRGARDLAFCLKAPLDSVLLWASSGGSGETARMRRLAWTFADRIGDKYQIRLTRSTCDWIRVRKCSLADQLKGPLVRYYYAVLNITENPIDSDKRMHFSCVIVFYWSTSLKECPQVRNGFSRSKTTQWNGNARNRIDGAVASKVVIIALSKH